MGVFQSTDVGILTGLGQQWEADCHVAFAFRESSVPRAHAGVTSGSRSAESRRLRSGMKVLWRRDCEGDCRPWRIDISCFDALAHKSDT